jgi:predicted ester cyclase
MLSALKLSESGSEPAQNVAVPPRHCQGRAGQKKIADDFRAAFPDLDVTVDLIVGEEDFVVGRWTASGTHRGPGGACLRGKRTAVLVFGHQSPTHAEWG